jgi:phospholipid/cholesterol/gamma-HCH transport system substrate-binding protein
MEIRAHHILIGVFTIGVFALALGFVLWLSRAGSEGNYTLYDIVFSEPVTGLSRGSLVQYNGIRVGEVVQLKLAPDDPRKVQARIRVEGGTPIRVDTRAKLGLLGVTGVAFIQLSGGAPGSKPLLPTDTHPIPMIPSEESALSKLLASGSDIVTSANDMVVRMTDMLSKENIARVSATLENLEQITATVAAQREELGSALHQLGDATAQLNRTLVTLDTMATTTNELIGKDAHEVLLATRQALDNVDKVAAAASGLLDDNRAAINSFSNQGLRQVGPAVAELREALRSFKQLTEKLGASDSLLLGRDQPREFEPQ